jgi:hypothetical protein
LKGGEGAELWLCSFPFFGKQLEKTEFLVWKAKFIIKAKEKRSSLKPNDIFFPFYLSLLKAWPPLSSSVTEWVGYNANMNISPHNLIKGVAYVWVVKWRTNFLRGPESAEGGGTSVSGNLGVANHCKWTGKWWSRLKDRTESEGSC